MPLSDEPNMGTWVITVTESGDEENVQRANFIVKKYVLPKFEATIDHHKKIRFDEKNIQVNVCGMYSYGKSVAGTYKLRAFTKKWSYAPIYQEIEDKAVEYEVLDVQNRCHKFEVKLEDLGIPGPRYTYQVTFEAAVTESDTDIEATASSSVTITYESMKIQVLHLEYYKPGFPIQFKVFWLLKFFL